MSSKPQTVLVVEDEASIASFVAALSEERRLRRAHGGERQPRR